MLTVKVLRRASVAVFESSHVPKQICGQKVDARQLCMKIRL